jgi:hypothetical protein
MGEGTHDGVSLVDSLAVSLGGALLAVESRALRELYGTVWRTIEGIRALLPQPARAPLMLTVLSSGCGMAEKKGLEALVKTGGRQWPTRATIRSRYGKR